MKALSLLFPLCGLSLVVLASCYAPPAPLASRRTGATSRARGADDAEDEGSGDKRRQDDGDGEESGEHAGHAGHTAEQAEADDGSLPSTGADVFSGAPAYKASSPPHKANDHHTDGSKSGAPCLGCHTGGEAPKFLFAGTVYRASTKQPAPSIHVRLLDADGKVQGSAHSDADGNFWVVQSSGGGTLTPGRTGARNATASKSMVAAVSNGNCNSCHDASNRVTVP